MSVQRISVSATDRQETNSEADVRARLLARLDEASRIAEEKWAAGSPGEVAAAIDGSRERVSPPGRANESAAESSGVEGTPEVSRDQEVGSEPADYLSGIQSTDCENPNPNPSQNQTHPNLGRHVEVRAKGCASWFCEYCCKPRGIKLRERLKERLATGGPWMMLTLTVDPQLFPSPEAAYRHVKETRAIPGLVRELHRKGFLNSKRFFYVVEFQPSGNPHWHLLVEAEFIPHDALKTAWNRYIPAGIDLSGCRAGLGAVFFSVLRFANAMHAASYVCKYLTKTPKEGWPTWVLRYQGEIRRYGISRGFWAKREESKPCEKCDDAKAPLRRKKRKSVGERVGDCGTDANVYVVCSIDTFGSVPKPHFGFLGHVIGGFQKALEKLGIRFVGQRSNQISNEQAHLLLGGKQPKPSFAGS